MSELLQSETQVSSQVTKCLRQLHTMGLTNGQFIHNSTPWLFVSFYSSQHYQLSLKQSNLRPAGHDTSIPAQVPDH
jgi:hypothetical protein